MRRIKGRFPPTGKSIRWPGARSAALAGLILLGLTSAAGAESEPASTGVYFPSSCLQGRRFEAIIHNMRAAGMDLAVLHVKDPRGRLFWDSKNPTAAAIGAVSHKTPVESAAARLKQLGFQVAAKLDVFQDTRLVESRPGYGVRDSLTGKPWSDRKGLLWADPYDHRVWDYNIELCLELIEMGIDEIQFDYIRFPSDGDLSRVEYSQSPLDVPPAECIGDFLARAKSRLEPTGVRISIDVFGMTAWKTGDFGVGQVLENMAPHVDVICPMFYPSHFPENFLSLEHPERYPYRILHQSMREMKKRTDRPVRPWLQGFWYTPDEIIAQLKGIRDADSPGWTVWSPTGRYATTFAAMEKHLGIEIPAPEFYPPLEKLKREGTRIHPGRSRLVNFTSYTDGYSILSLDETTEGVPNPHGTMLEVVATLDEGIMDEILSRRGRVFDNFTGPYGKAVKIAALVIEDLDVDPRRMRPAPIFVDWEGDCVFSRGIPPEKRDVYRAARDQAPER